MAAASSEVLESSARGSDADVRLLLDFDACTSAHCPMCSVQCSYYHHPGNNGVLSLAEMAAYALVCRRCEVPHCVNSCPRDALEQDKEQGRLLVRHGMRCVSCRTCSHACPYGTIYPELVPLVIHVCDFCSDRRERPGEPRCVATCPNGALALHAVEGELPANTFQVGKHLLVHSTHWEWDKA